MKETKWVLGCAFAVVAVAGAMAQQTARGAQLARGAQPPPMALTVPKFVGHQTIAGCTKSGTFVNTPEYTVLCTNRTGAGVVEIHKKATDVIYVVDGAATFVTEGTALHVTAANSLQPRGTDIQGGNVHRLVKGDVIVVPAGIPHWFKEVPTSVSYYVVKVLKP